jgi:dephospho-CoA kinase
MKFALTGGIAAGKSMVAEILRREGLTILDADQLARNRIESSPEIIRRIAAEFGPRAVAAGKLQRKYLAELLFADPAKLARYNELLREPLLGYFADLLTREEKRRGIVGLEAALVSDWGVAHWFQLVIVVSAPREERLRRLQERDGLTREAALARLEAQASPEKMLRTADLVLINDGTQEELAKKVRGLLPQLRGERK